MPSIALVGPRKRSLGSAQAALTLGGFDLHLSHSWEGLFEILERVPIALAVIDEEILQLDPWSARRLLRRFEGAVPPALLLAGHPDLPAAAPLWPKAGELTEGWSARQLLAKVRELLVPSDGLVAAPLRARRRKQGRPRGPARAVVVIDAARPRRLYLRGLFRLHDYTVETFAGPVQAEASALAPSCQRLVLGGLRDTGAARALLSTLAELPAAPRIALVAGDHSAPIARALRELAPTWIAESDLSVDLVRWACGVPAAERDAPWPLESRPPLARAQWHDR